MLKLSTKDSWPISSAWHGDGDEWIAFSRSLNQTNTGHDEYKTTLYIFGSLRVAQHADCGHGGPARCPCTRRAGLSYFRKAELGGFALILSQAFVGSDIGHGKARKLQHLAYVRDLRIIHDLGQRLTKSRHI